ncbi:hypothetical protein BV898_14613 [Hypsibius exemplaris]|uniref:Uncharacterized protein n=1 Tax=Hypsibius exemplaris TaxID=2072580 RepID=A0A9X6N951_HYPEX|nr:hypothetical protein BV898_14613 [Hypsibius exemplaris]
MRRREFSTDREKTQLHPRNNKSLRGRKLPGDGDLGNCGMSEMPEIVAVNLTAPVYYGVPVPYLWHTITTTRGLPTHTLHTVIKRCHSSTCCYNADLVGVVSVKEK